MAQGGGDGAVQKITLFGATGGTGRALLKLLLDDPRDYSVTCLCRNSAALDKHERLHVVQGNLLNQDEVRAAVKGADAVVFVAGVASPKQAFTERTVIYSQGGQNILDAMAAEGVYRLVAVTSSGTTDFEEPLFWLYTVKPLVFGDMYADMRKFESAMDVAVQNDPKFKISVLRPPMLVDVKPPGAEMGWYTTERTKPGWFTEIPKLTRDDLAVALKQELESGSNAGKKVVVSY